MALATATEQVTQVVGALLILAAFAAAQFGVLDQHSRQPPIDARGARVPAGPSA